MVTDTRIQLGAGNKLFGKVSFVIHCLMLLFVIFGMIVFQTLWFFAIIMFVALMNTKKVASTKYVYLQGNSFVIENIFNKRKYVNVNQFRDVVRSRSAYPFSNVIEIRFLNGEEVEITGGGKSLKELKDTIESRLRA